MNLQEKITEDIKFSMKNGEATRLGVLRQLKNTMMNASLAKGNVKTPLNDNEVLNIIRKQVVQREDSISQFTKGNRPDLVEREKQELTVLTAYLPVALPIEEVEKIVQRAILDTNSVSRKDTGKFMKRAMELAENRVDSKTLIEKFIEFCEAGQQTVTITPVE